MNSLRMIGFDLLDVYSNAEKFSFEFYLSIDHISLEPSDKKHILTLTLHDFDHVSLILSRSEFHQVLLKDLFEESVCKETEYKPREDIDIGPFVPFKSLRIQWFKDPYGLVGLTEEWLVLGSTEDREHPKINLIRNPPFGLLKTLLMNSILSFTKTLVS